MPDFKNFSIAALSTANVSVPRFTISVQVVNSQTGALITDLTGANALAFPGVLTSLTVQQRRDLLDLLVNQLILIKAGLA